MKMTTLLAVGHFLHMGQALFTLPLVELSTYSLRKAILQVNLTSMQFGRSTAFSS